MVSYRYDSKREENLTQRFIITYLKDHKEAAFYLAFFLTGSVELIIFL